MVGKHAQIVNLQTHGYIHSYVPTLLRLPSSSRLVKPRIFIMQITLAMQNGGDDDGMKRNNKNLHYSSRTCVRNAWTSKIVHTKLRSCLSNRTDRQLVGSV